MGDFSAINRPSLLNPDGSMSVREYERKSRELEEACRQFEGQMFGKLWKDMMKSARLGEERKREYGPLEDTVVEMVSEHMSEARGIGMWKVLYDSLLKQLPKPVTVDEQREEA